MNRTKVLHVVTKLELGGAQQNTLHTVSHLDPTRYDAVLVSGSGGILDPEVLGLGVRVVFVPSLVRPVRPWHDVRALWALYRLFKKEKPTIVHTHSSKAGVLGRWAAVWAKVPVLIHTFHGFGHHREQPRLVREFFVQIERFLARRTSQLITVSLANQREALQRGIGTAGQHVLIRSGVFVKAFQGVTKKSKDLPGLSIPPGHRLITTIGPFKPQKNLKDFLEAARLVLEKRSDVIFLVVGDGAGRPDLEQRIRRHRLNNRVFLTGWRRDIPDVLARTDIFCMTSLWEGLPRSLVEALCAGIPSVVNAVDGCTDLIVDGDNGFLVAPKQPHTTADRLLTLLENPTLFRQISDRARTTIGPDFDIDAMVKQQEALYQRLTPPS